MKYLLLSLLLLGGCATNSPDAIIQKSIGEFTYLAEIKPNDVWRNSQTGDCEDWVFYTYDQLIKHGVPKEDLKIAFGRVSDNTYHATLEFNGYIFDHQGMKGHWLLMDKFYLTDSMIQKGVDNKD